jgi:F420-non-reducing hydrogenase iron-sulfur subunit
MNDFEPKIIAFLCNWCSYVAADAAGVSRLMQQPNLRVIRLFCSGMADPSYIKAMRRSFLLKRLLADLGLEADRFRLEWIAASEPQKYVDVIKQMIETVRRLGPSPLKRSNPSVTEEENSHLRGHGMSGL